MYKIIIFRVFNECYRKRIKYEDFDLNNGKGKRRRLLSGIVESKKPTRYEWILG